MRFKSCLLAILFLFFIESSLKAQTSFFLPPSFSGSGTTFVADFNGDGKTDILTSDGSLSLGNGDGTFTIGIKVSGTPLAVADINGDAKPDIVEQGTGTLLVLLGKGDGTFQAAISTASGANLTNVTAVDLNGDGKWDLVGLFSSALVAYVSEGDGTFTAGVSYSLGPFSNQSPQLALGDFNGDHKMDVVVSDDGVVAAGQEFVFLGNGDGTFQSVIISAGIPVNNFIEFSTTADFNRDGKLDVVVSTEPACHGICSGTGYLLLGNGDGTFQPPSTEFTSFGPIAATDVNGDGKPDLITEPDPTVAVAAVYLGNGDGTFSSGNSYVQSFSSGIPPVSDGIAVADFNGDGKLDIAAASAILLSNGDGTFRGIPFVNGPQPPAVAGDFDKNGTMDLATASSVVDILTNTGNGVLSVIHTYSLPVNLTAVGIVSADLNGDGNLDLVVNQVDPSGTSWSYSVLLGNGDGSFQAPLNYSQSTAAGSFPLVQADFNNDNKVDLAVAAGTSSVAILLGNGDGTFSSPVYYFDGGGGPLFTGDFNSDGKFDILISGNPFNSTQTATLFGNGDGTFAAAVFPASLTGYSPQFTADLNNDGKPDLISSNQVALGNGDGTFRLLSTLSPGNGGSYSVTAVADLNADGKSDLIVTLLDSRSVPLNTGLLLGNADGTFGPPVDVTTNGVVPVVLIADMNGDSKPDVVFSWPAQGSITILRGLGVFLSLGVQAPDFTVGPAPGSLISQTVSAGQPASYSLVFTPSASFSGTVNLSCAITPVVSPAPSCALSTSSLQLNNSGTQQVTVTVGTSTAAAASTLTALPPGTWALAMLWMFLGTMSVWLWSRKCRPAFAAILAFGLLFCPGCGGGGSSGTNPGSGTPAGTYTVAITATSGPLSHTVNLQLVVQ